MRRLFIILMLAFAGVVLLGTVTRSIVLSVMLARSSNSVTEQEALSDARDIASWARDRWDRSPDEIRFSLNAMARVADARIWLVAPDGRVRVDTHSSPSWEGVQLQDVDLSPALKGEETQLQGRSPWLESAVAHVVPVIREG